MIDASKFMGLGETQARSLAEGAGLTVVVSTKAPTMLTNSMRMDRITLVVQGGMVTSARIGCFFDGLNIFRERKSDEKRGQSPRFKEI